jgi:hypothetical protein
MLAAVAQGLTMFLALTIGPSFDQAHSWRAAELTHVGRAVHVQLGGPGADLAKPMHRLSGELHQVELSAAGWSCVAMQSCKRSDSHGSLPFA